MEKEIEKNQELFIDGSEDNTVEIDPIEIGYEILSKIKYVILCAVLGIILAGAYLFLLSVPSYEAVAKLYVVDSNDSVISLSDFQLGNYLTSDYSEMFKTWEVNETVRRNLGLSYTYDQLQAKVKMTNPSDTRVLYITAASSDPNEAMLLANEYADVVSDYILSITDGKKPTMLSTALLPTKPVSPKKARVLMIGMMLGVLLSASIIALRYIVNDIIRSPKDAEKSTGLPVLSIIPLMKNQEEKNKKQGRRRRK